MTHTCNSSTSALRKWKQEFNANLGYIGSSKLAHAKRVPVSKTMKKLSSAQTWQESSIEFFTNCVLKNNGFSDI